MTAMRRPLGRLFYWPVVIAAALCGYSPAQQPSTTVVTDIVYRANGTPAAGTLVFSWPAFTTADNKPVAAGTFTVSLGAGGALNVALVPTQNATPQSYYRVVYKLADGTTHTEYWNVGSTSPTTVAAVRSTVLPATVAAQFATKQYVDAAVATRSIDSTVVHLQGSESITGQKAFVVSPTAPDPVAEGSVATKRYVDAAIAGGAPGQFVLKSGDSMTGPLSLNGAPTLPNHAATRQYVDAADSVLQGDIVQRLFRNNGRPISLAGTYYADQFLSVQDAVLEAGPNGRVVIPPDYSGSEEFSNPNNISVEDQRGRPGRQKGFVNCKTEFGMKGDGSSDDSARLQACIDANPGKRLFLPKMAAPVMGGGAGTVDYYAAQTVYLHGNGTTLEGESPGAWSGSTRINFAPGVAGLVVSPTCFGCEVRNIEVYGQRCWSTTELTSFDPPATQSPTVTSGMRGTGADGIVLLAGHARLENVAATCFGRHGIHASGDSTWDTVQVTSATVNASGYATYTTASPHRFRVGYPVTVLGTSDAMFNRVITVTSATATTITGAVPFTSGSATGGVASAVSQPDSVSITHVRVDSNRGCGILMIGGDSNAGVGTRVDSRGNFLGGICDKSQLGNTWVQPTSHIDARDAIVAGTTQAIQSIAASGGLCTLTTAATLANGVPTIGTWVEVAGTSGGAGFNGTFRLSGVNVAAREITYSCTASGGPATGGAVGTASSTAVFAKIAADNPEATCGAFCGGGGSSKTLFVGAYGESNSGFSKFESSALVLNPQIANISYTGAQVLAAQPGRALEAFTNELRATNKTDTTLTLTLQPGGTSEQIGKLAFAQRDGTAKWAIQKTAAVTPALWFHDVTGNCYPVQLNGGGTMELAPCAGAAVRVSNNQGGNFQFFGGTSTAMWTMNTAGQLVSGNLAKTSSSPLLDLAQTWNANGVFTGIRFNASCGSVGTDCAAGSLLLDLQKNAASVFRVQQDGAVTAGAVNATSGYQVNGSALSSAHLADGTTGTGAVVLASAPQLGSHVEMNAIAAPGAPASGKARVYVNSTSKKLCSKDDAGVESCVGSAGLGYSLPLWSNVAANPTDAQTVYIGFGAGSGMQTSFDNAKIPVPAACSIERVAIKTRTTGTLGSAETVTISVLVNNTSETNSTTMGWNTANSEAALVCSTNCVVNAGDSLALKVVQPTWATNPTSVLAAANLYCR